MESLVEIEARRLKDEKGERAKKVKAAAIRAKLRAEVARESEAFGKTLSDAALEEQAATVDPGLRPRTFALTLLLTTQEGALIRSLLYSGLLGTSEGEVAERLIAEALRFPSAVKS